MGWLGKIIGGAIGFAVGGPIGAIAGASIGHVVDNNSEEDHKTTSLTSISTSTTEQRPANDCTNKENTGISVKSNSAGNISKVDNQPTSFNSKSAFINRRDNFDSDYEDLRDEIYSEENWNYYFGDDDYGDSNSFAGCHIEPSFYDDPYIDYYVPPDYEEPYDPDSERLKY